MTTNSLVVDTTEVHNVMLGVSRATLYRLLSDDPTFPKPFKIGTRKNSWFRVSVEAWITARAAEAAMLRADKTIDALAEVAA